MGLPTLVLLLVVLNIQTHVQGYCEFQSPSHITTEYGTSVFYCEYKGLKMLKPSRLIDLDDCMQVSCTDSGMSLCGYGVNAGSFGSPKGCKVVGDGCEPKTIQDPATSQICPAT